MTVRHTRPGDSPTPPRGDARPPRFSIVVPLYDCRDAGMRAVDSALAQDFPRDRFEVIAIVDARVSREAIDAPLAQCDQVIAVDADFASVDAEIALFDAGARAASGDYLYFIEGHTVLDPGAVRALASHLRLHRDCAIVCGRRANHARTNLGILVGGNNDAHEARALARGNFTLGANCAIRRDVFARLGGFDARFARFGETVLCERARDAGVGIGALDAVLCTHHNDTGFRWLVRLLLATGRAKARYYATPGVTRVRHPVYRWVGSPLTAALAAWPLRVAGPAAILLAIAIVRRVPAQAHALYRVAIGMTDVAGYCLERSAWRTRRSVPRCITPDSPRPHGEPGDVRAASVIATDGGVRPGSLA